MFSSQTKVTVILFVTSSKHIQMHLLFSSNKIKRILKDGQLKIAVYGLGHVGCPLAAAWLRAGANVIGVDTNPDIINKATKGISPVAEPGVPEAFKKGLKTHKLSFTSDGIVASKESNFKVVTVPVGVEDGHASLSALEDAVSNIAKGLKRGDVISINPTVPPSTTENLLPILEKVSGLKNEIDFGLIYSPERISEGTAIKDIEENYPAIVAGIGPKSLAVGDALYSLISKKGVIKMSGIRAAETEKLFEGVYRDVNIALANELGKICERLGIDYWEVRKAANSQPYSHLHKPGTGVGGACIPIYPHFVMEVAAKVKASTDITQLAREINSYMPKYCVQEALSMLNKTGKQTANSKVTVLGLAFRGGVSDTRLSPSYDVIQELLNAGCSVTVHDPHVSTDSKLPRSVVLTKKLDEALSDSDLVIIATDHPQYAKINPKRLRANTAIYDGRGILDRTRFGNVLFSGIGRAKQ